MFIGSEQTGSQGVQLLTNSSRREPCPFSPLDRPGRRCSLWPLGVLCYAPRRGICAYLQIVGFVMHLIIDYAHIKRPRLARCAPDLIGRVAGQIERALAPGQLSRGKSEALGGAKVAPRRSA